MSAEERVAAVEKAHADEEAAQSAVLAELKRLRENAFKQTQEFNQLKGICNITVGDRLNENC